MSTQVYPTQMAPSGEQQARGETSSWKTVNVRKFASLIGQVGASLPSRADGAPLYISSGDVAFGPRGPPRYTQT